MKGTALNLWTKRVLSLSGFPVGKIPRYLHQTWKMSTLPAPLQELRNSWKPFHPQWKTKLWTDQKNRELISEHYAWFLPVYDSYPENIQRADAFRYFVLYHFGGVYADVDFEALKPLDPLLQNRSFFAGVEPASHEIEHGRGPILCNALMGSVPGHPFLRFLLKRLLLTKDDPNVLSSTGPFFLSDCYEAYWRKSQISVLKSNAFYPLDAPHYHLLQDREVGGEHPFGEDTYALHYWQGSNWRNRRKEVPVSVVGGKTELFSGTLNVTATLARKQARMLPMVSCLMVTAGRPGLASCSIECFLKQTYGNLELLILDEGTSDVLEKEICQINDPRIRYIREEKANGVLGERRQRSVEMARGDFICQWDDDDLSHPERIEIQMAAIFEFEADVSFLNSERLWWPARGQLAVSKYRAWENTLICRKEIMPVFPSLPSGEDVAVVLELLRKSKTVLVGDPGLYTYVYHGTNTTDEGRFGQIWEQSSHICQGDRYLLEYHLLNTMVPLDRYVRACGLPVPPNPAGKLRGKVRKRIGPKKIRNALHLLNPDLSKELPKVLVLTPMKNVKSVMESYFSLLAGLEYPVDRLSLGILEGDSTDGSDLLIPEMLKKWGHLFSNHHFIKRDYNFELEGKRWTPALQRERRGILARCRNYLLQETLADEEWVLWLDADVVDYPQDSLLLLLKTKKDIVVPTCCRSGTGRIFDMNTYIWSDPYKMDAPETMMDGLYQPEAGVGRKYLDEFEGTPLIQVDSVGGTMLLVRADLHREGLVFPVAPYRGYLETEGLAMMAKDWGYSSWGIPGLKILHADG